MSESKPVAPDVLSLTPRQVKELLKAQLQAAEFGREVAVHLAGSPGIGKTIIPQQLATELEIECDLFHPLLYTPIDAVGLPTSIWSEEDKVHLQTWARPARLRKDPNSAGIFVIDEIAASGKEMEKACAGILHPDKTMGETKLPKRWIVVSTGNLSSDRADSKKLFSHVRNRVMEVRVRAATADEWREDWAIPSGLHESVISYTRMDPDCLFQFNPDSDDQQATPRSWSALGRQMHHLPSHLILHAAAGLVGAGLARKFMTFIKLREEMPDPKDVLANPDTAKVSKEPGIIWNLIGTLAAICKKGESSATKANLEACIRYIRRHPVVYNILMVKELHRYNPSILSNPEGRIWIKEYAKYFQSVNS